MKNKKEIKFMSSVAEEIIKMDFSEKQSVGSLKKKFYKIMRKYSIKKGGKEGKRVVCNNFEWTMCWCLFTDTIHSKFNWYDILSDIPRDLKCY